MKRRKFIKSSIGTATAVTSSGIFFPKPANSSSINYLLSQEATSEAVFQTFIASRIAQGASESLPPATDSAVVNAVQKVQSQLDADKFVDGKTPFSKRLGNADNPLWGQQRNEDLGPNPGFGTVQIQRNRIDPIVFTGSTTAGIDRSIAILSDQQYNAQELDNALIPIQERFEDWGTWGGDVDPRTGSIISTTSLAEYETRYGSVIRRYTVEEPGPGGFGIIRFDIRGGRFVNERILIRVKFTL